MVLDEPNSNLDSKGDEALANAVNVLKARGATVIMITHRVQTLANMNKLLVLQDGMINKYGSRDEVLASAGMGGAPSSPGAGPPTVPSVSGKPEQGKPEADRRRMPGSAAPKNVATTPPPAGPGPAQRGVPASANLPPPPRVEELPSARRARSGKTIPPTLHPGTGHGVRPKLGQGSAQALEILAARPGAGSRTASPGDDSGPMVRPPKLETTVRLQPPPTGPARPAPVPANTQGPRPEKIVEQPKTARPLAPPPPTNVKPVAALNIEDIQSISARPRAKQ